jgi:hypothetical protein
MTGRALETKAAAAQARPLRSISTHALWQLFLDAGTKKPRIAAMCRDELQLRADSEDGEQRPRTEFQIRGSAGTDAAALARLVNFIRGVFGFTPLKVEAQETLVLTARGGSWACAAAPVALERLNPKTIPEIMRLSMPFGIEVRFLELKETEAEVVR